MLVEFTLNMKWGVADQGKTIYAKVKRRDKKLLQTKEKKKRLKWKKKYMKKDTYIYVKKNQIKEMGYISTFTFWEEITLSSWTSKVDIFAGL